MGRWLVVAVCAVLLRPLPLLAQPNATLQGRIVDASGAIIPGATVTMHHTATGLTQTVSSNEQGRYRVAGVVPGVYGITAAAAGFRSDVIDAVTFDVGRTLVQDFRLAVVERAETVLVSADAPLVDRVSATVGHIVTTGAIRELPLNGRQFADLGLLVPGSVAPSPTAFSSTPFRGIGALAINTAGNREEAVGFLVNGVTSNNLSYGSLGFQPPIGSVQEFKVDNSTFSAEFGHVSGAIVNIVTRSGTEAFSGDLFEFYRNDALDARNFFELTSSDPHPFERHQFGGSLGGPIVRGRSFFFATYEGVRQEQGLDMNSLVLSDAQRAAVTDPAVRRLVELIPQANLVDAAGTPRFVGSAHAVVDMDRWTVDLRHSVSAGHRLHLFYGLQRYETIEPAATGATIPGFGYQRSPNLSVLTASDTHMFGAVALNELRVGRNTLDGRSTPVAQLDPAEFGIGNGVTRPIGLPQITVAGGLSFGGPASNPVGRRDASYVLTDTFSVVRGRHALKLGGEYRHFINENFAEGTGSFTFPSVDAFLSGVANAFAITLGERRNAVDQRAVGLFLQDAVTLRPNLSLELGVRYEWHVTPTERDDRFVVFDPAAVALLRVGTDVDAIYRQNNRNIEPRVGLAWDPGGQGRTVVRAAYAHAVDEPGTQMVAATAGNPPWAMPLTAAGAIPLENALATTQPAGLAPATVDAGFRNAMLRSWNVNVQRQLARPFAAMVGYFGSRGANLRLVRNINQPVNGVRPFSALSVSSPILPGTPLGTIMQVESTGFSTYHGLWTSATKRLSHGLQFDASYVWSKSLDTNSLNSTGFAIQDSYDIGSQYGPSDYDVRHRFVLSALYELPFGGHPLARGWHVAAIVQSQSGNPVNIVTSNSTLNGVPNTVRPDLTGPIAVTGSAEQWFDRAAFTAVNRFGNLGRNAVIGPGFHNTDLSIVKSFTPSRARVQLRVDVFDLFNHANFGPPGNIVGSPTFGTITRTRLPTGEAGSSRQIQLAAKLAF